MLRKTYVTVDLDAIRANYMIMRSRVPEDVRVMPVIKADAYGHGMLEVAKALSRLGTADFAIATPDEGITLREGGITANILVLGAAMPAAAEETVRHNLTQTVFTPEAVRCINEAARALGKTALVNIKLDTGMNRIGLRTEDEADALANALADAEHVRATGIYTHFADADNPPPAGDGKGALNDFSREQLRRFKILRAHFDSGIPAHVANSALSLVAPEAYYNMVREGVSLYGYPPVKTDLTFRHALRWVSEVVHIKEIDAGDTVSYGCTFTAQGRMRVATVAVGYGDGYHRFASGKAQMLIEGKRANVLGRVCMDQVMVDVTDIPEAHIGSEAVIIGAQGDDEIDAEELAHWSGTISYEVLLAISGRVPRIYLNADE